MENALSPLGHAIRRMLYCAAICLLFSPLTAAQTAPGNAGAKTLRIYTIGNSVTDSLNYDAFSRLLRSRGYEPVVARQMIPGAPLSWLWEHPRDGFKTDPYGYPEEAFVRYAWDAISLQPFDRKLDSDIKNIEDYIELARRNPANRSTTFYIYARWPRMQRDGKDLRDPEGKPLAGPTKITDHSRIDPWQRLWSRAYTGGWDLTEESKDYFETLTRQVRKRHPDVAIYMIPVGHVMAALDARMRKGEMPGLPSIWAVYSDTIHMEPLGRYIVGVTFFATMTGESPVGLPTEPYGTIDPQVARIVQQTAWEVVTSNALTGRMSQP